MRTRVRMFLVVVMCLMMSACAKTAAPQEVTTPTMSEVISRYVGESDKTAHKNLVALGLSAVPTCVKMYDEGKFTNEEGLKVAKAIEDILDVDMVKVTGFEWETAEDFFDLLDQALCDMPQILGILEREKKLQVIHDDYGAIGQAWAWDLSQNNGEEAFGLMLGRPLSAREYKEIESWITLDKDELATLAHYVSSYSADTLEEEEAQEDNNETDEDLQL